jgi:hypothetical protein
MKKWKAPCGRTIDDTGQDGRNLHLVECRGCAEVFLSTKRRKAEAARLGARR